MGELRPRDLASHLGLAATTVSEAVKRLIILELVEVRPPSGDRRAKPLGITTSGRAAIEHQSVLDARVVSSAIKKLSVTKRCTAFAGPKILADASSAVRQESTKARR